MRVNKIVVSAFLGAALLLPSCSMDDLVQFSESVNETGKKVGEVNDNLDAAQRNAKGSGGQAQPSEEVDEPAEATNG